MVVFVLARLWRFVKVLSECLFVVLLFLFLLTPKGGRGCLMLSSCLESQGCRLILLSYLQLFSFSFSLVLLLFLEVMIACRWQVQLATLWHWH